MLCIGLGNGMFLRQDWIKVLTRPILAGGLWVGLADTD